MLDYWRQQNQKEPLFADILWSKPENKATAGCLGIVGGNRLGFLAVANAYKNAIKTGIGQVKLVLPNSLKKTLGQIEGAYFADANPSGSLAKSALADLLALETESNALLFIGDAGKNTETQALYETFFQKNQSNKPLIITRDAFDLILSIANQLISRSNITLILSFSQLQKLFHSVYYPIVLVHSMQTSKLVEALHKFTITHSVNLVVFHNDQLLMAQGGRVFSSLFEQATDIWQGILPAKIATWITWLPQRPLEASITALIPSA